MLLMHMQIYMELYMVALVATVALAAVQLQVAPAAVVVML
jgi:hypothetical protein